METLNLIAFYNRFPNEDACHAYLAESRWHGEPICPHCGCLDVYTLKSRRIFKCTACMKQFSARIGTIFEESRLPLQKWFLAIYLLTSHKKGVSSIQMSKHLGITQKSAWFLLQRIRHAVLDGSDRLLNGIVEVDETYIGGHQKGVGMNASNKSTNKTPVMGLVERKGHIKTHIVTKGSAPYLLPHIIKDIDPRATVMTDQLKAYHALTAMGYPHYSVNHTKEYVVGTVHTNTIEGYWSHLKSGIDAIYIGVSRKHMAKYAGEFGYRYNTREMKDGERFENWFGYASGKRLTYKGLIG
ncbi:MAG TPA: IS1595 family transposase [Candidatus Saccharimonadia bacterium]|nr:IS1595 family transposase [Candidatus Saccharimonadia bacterium]